MGGRQPTSKASTRTKRKSKRTTRNRPSSRRVLKMVNRKVTYVGRKKKKKK